MVSIIIVNFNTDGYLRKCIASLLIAVKVPFEIIVVDNCSTDHSLHDLPDFEKLRVLRESTNHGFAKACNLGEDVAIGSILHFLNPDTEVRDDINLTYAQAMTDQSQIYVTRILDGTHRIETTNHLLPLFKNLVYALFARERRAVWYLGASIIVSKILFRRLGRLSEDYFMYAEDVDFFYKAHLAGVRTQLTDSVIVHFQGGTSRQIWSSQERLARVEHSAAIFARKFGLRLDYFLFKHIAIFRQIWRHPVPALMELKAYWRELIRRPKTGFDTP